MGREWGVIIDFVDKNGSNLSNVRPPCARQRLGHLYRHKYLEFAVIAMSHLSLH